MGKLKASLIKIFNRPGTRGLLGLIFSFLATLKQGRIINIQYDRKQNHWLHRHSKYTFLIELLPNFSATAERFQNHVSNTFYKHYQPQPGHLILDVGAGVGTLVAPFLDRIEETGKVYAIEAHPNTYNCLERLIQANGWAQIHCRHLAISNNNDPILIEDTDNHSANSILNKEGTIAVPAMTLDEFVKKEKIEEIHFLKINIEGAEKPALEAISNTLAITHHVAIACHDQLAVTTGNDFYKTKDFVTTTLVNHGFEVTGNLFVSVDHWVFASKKQP